MTQRFPFALTYTFQTSTPAGAEERSFYTYPLFVRPWFDAEEFMSLLRSLHQDHFTLVVDAGVPRHIIERVYQQVSAVGPCLQLSFQPTEQIKTMETVLTVMREARLHGGGTHRSCLIALGGGLIGNITGLAARLLVRGIQLIHMPTTLLAASDSVLSCKQGVNVEVEPGLLIKNLAGSFKAPAMVLVYLSFLETLTADEVRSGLCELIKNVVGIHPDLYHQLHALLKPDASYSRDEYLRIFDWCFKAKQRVMRTDAHEQGPALVLELGHTVGHALEALTGMKHGLAVGLGLLVAAHISLARGYLTPREVEMHYRLLERNGAPVSLPEDIAPDELLKRIEHDNKIGYLPPGEGYPMVLLEHLGKPHMSHGIPLVYVAEEELRAGISAALQRGKVLR